MEVSNKEEYPLMKTDIEIAQSIELKPIVDVVEKSCREAHFGDGYQPNPSW